MDQTQQINRIKKELDVEGVKTKNYERAEDKRRGYTHINVQVDTVLNGCLGTNN